MSATTTDEEIKRELAAEFGGWSILHTDRDRWWATRYPVPDPHVPGRLIDHQVTALEADTAEQLRERLLAVHQPPGP